MLLVIVMRSSSAFLSFLSVKSNTVKSLHGKSKEGSQGVTRNAWHWVGVIGGSTSILCGLTYLVHHHREAKRATDRRQGILRLTAVTLSKATVKTVMTDHEVVKDLKQFGLSILKSEELKKSLKVLVKEQAGDDETKNNTKIFITKHLWKDMWIHEEIIGMAQYLGNQVKQDPNIFPMPLLSNLGSVAIKAFGSKRFLDDLKTELKKVCLSVLRGPPQYSPWVIQKRHLSRLSQSLFSKST